MHKQHILSLHFLFWVPKFSSAMYCVLHTDITSKLARLIAILSPFFVLQCLLLIKWISISLIKKFSPYSRLLDNYFIICAKISSDLSQQLSTNCFLRYKCGAIKFIWLINVCKIKNYDIFTISILFFTSLFAIFDGFCGLIGEFSAAIFNGHNYRLFSCENVARWLCD